MIGSINCIYETPCGWCSKWDKECDKKIGTATLAKISTNQFDENNVRNSVYDPRTGGFADIVVTETAKVSAPKRCGGCDKTDGTCCISNPPKVKCTITGKFHFYDDVCDCDTITATN